MVKVLFYSEGWGLGGIEKFIINTIECLNHSRFVCDVFCTHDWSDAYDATISANGGKRYCCFPGEKPSLPKRMIVSCSAFYRLLEKKQYDIVHINTMNGMGFVYAFIAFLAGVKVRVVHSHNTSFGDGHKYFKLFFHKLGILLFSRFSTVNLACSRQAGHYLFEDKAFRVLKNGVDFNRVCFSNDQRIRQRVEMNIPEDSFVFGSVGRLEESKNPFYQLDLLKQMLAYRKNVFLILLGDGSLKEALIKKAKDLLVNENVFFPGTCDDIGRYLSTMDVFTLPSLFEGFPMVIVEASTNGLPIIVSDSVDFEDFPTDNVSTIPLSQRDRWIKKLKFYQDKGFSINDRLKGTKRMVEAGYSRESNAKKLEHIYIDSIGQQI